MDGGVTKDEGENEYDVVDGGVTKDEGGNVDVGDDENNKGEGDCDDDLFLCRFWAEKPAFFALKIDKEFLLFFSWTGVPSFLTTFSP